MKQRIVRIAPFTLLLSVLMLLLSSCYAHDSGAPVAFPASGSPNAPAILSPIPEAAADVALTSAPTAPPTAVTTVTATPTPIETATQLTNSRLEVHIIDVGQGDAILLLCDGQSMLIDGGTPQRSQTVVAYLKKHGVTQLDYVINTHPHEDHAGGLAGVLNVFPVGNVSAAADQYDSKAFSDFLNYTAVQGLSIQILSPGDTLSLGSASLHVLAVNTSQNTDNDSSAVLRCTHGKITYLFTGDASAVTEQHLCDSGFDLRADVLKVAHHGGDDATGYRFLREVMPAYAAISVGEENAYGHPTDAVLSRLSDAGAVLLRTDCNGDILFTDDGETLTVTTEKTASEEALRTSGDREQDEENPTEQLQRDQGPASAPYIGNLNSKVFHRTSCGTLPQEKNRVYFDTREAAILAGYAPCQNCDP